jgi:hypothetical protein
MACDLQDARAFEPALREALDRVPRARPIRSIHDKAEKEEALAHEEARALALRDLRRMIEKAGGQVRNDWNGAAVRIHGLRATATSGLEQACRNWLTQVVVKTARERMAAGDSTGAWVPA